MPFVVRGGEPVRDLRGKLGRFAHRQRAASDRLAQRLALEQLEDDIRGVRVLADVEDLRMLG